MTLFMRDGETQRAFVERTLREQGSISAHEAMFDMRTADGDRCSITRLAAIVETLRKAGWVIETHAPHGEQAVYRLCRIASESPRFAPVTGTQEGLSL